METGQVVGIALERLGHLDGELARGGEHQHLRVVAGEVDAVQQRQRKGGGFAGAGLGFAEDVMPLHQRRDARGLDGGGGLVTDLGERAQDWGGQAELLKGFDVGCHDVLKPDKNARRKARRRGAARKGGMRWQKGVEVCKGWGRSALAAARATRGG